MSLPLKSSGHHCFACREPANEDDCFRIIDRLCHPGCFKCQTCQKNLNSNMFCVALGDLYCEKHCKESISTNDHTGVGYAGSQISNGRLHQNSHDRVRCFICGLPVEEPEPLTGINGTFHGGCFRCHLCRRILNIEKYKVIKGKLCCEPACEAYEKSFARPNSLSFHHQNGYGTVTTPGREHSRPVSPRSFSLEICYNCGLSVKSKDRLWVLDRVYHKDCFRCRRCGIVLSPDKYNVENQQPCCQPNCIDQIEQRSIKIPANWDSSTRSSTLSERQVPKRSHSTVLGSRITESPDGTHKYRGDLEKIAKIHRRLEQIQASEVEEVKCYACGRKVYPAERLQILNRIYHPDCLKCDTCERVLNGGRYSVHEGKVYCIAHHRELLNLKNLSIQDRLTLFGNQSAFSVPLKHGPANRMKPDGSSVMSFASDADKPLKKEYVPKPEMPKIQTATPIVHDEEEIFQESKPEELKCYECGIKVYPAEQLNILSRVYHRTCFKCKTCQNVLDLGRYGVYEGVPYCNAHHKQAVNLGSLSSLSVNTTTAKTPATPQQKRMAMHVESETAKCFECDKKVYPAEQLNILKRVYHKSCFRCKTCQKTLNVGRYGVYDGNPYCNAHHRQVLNLHSTSMTNVSVIAEVNNNKTESGTSDIAAMSEPSPFNPPYEKRIQQSSNRTVSSLSKTRCFECGELTKPDSSVILLDRVYHLECLKCRACHKQLSRWNYKEMDGLIYCSRDYAELIVSRAKVAACDTNQTDRTLFV